MNRALSTAILSRNTPIKSGVVYSYSVKEYADYLLAHANERDDLKRAAPLVKAMLNYGAYAQIYFDKNPNNLANADLIEADKTLGEVTISEPQTVFALPESVTFAGSTLSLKSETTLSLYFTGDQFENRALSTAILSRNTPIICLRTRMKEMI